METEHKDLNELIMSVLTEGDKTEAASIDFEKPKTKNEKNVPTNPDTIKNYQQLIMQLGHQNSFSVNLSPAKIDLYQKLGKQFYQDSDYEVITYNDDSDIVTIRPINNQDKSAIIQVPFSALKPNNPADAKTSNDKNVDAAADWYRDMGANFGDTPYIFAADGDSQNDALDQRQRNIVSGGDPNKDDEGYYDPYARNESKQFTKEPNMETITESKKKGDKKEDNKDLFDSDMEKAHEKGFHLRKPPKKRPFLKKKSCD